MARRSLPLSSQSRPPTSSTTSAGGGLPCELYLQVGRGSLAAFRGSETNGDEKFLTARHRPHERWGIGGRLDAESEPAIHGERAILFGDDLRACGGAQIQVRHLGG